MEVATASDVSLVLVRLHPGEPVLESLVKIFEDAGLAGASIVSTVASVRDVTYSVAHEGPDGCMGRSPVMRRSGAIEVASMQGHLGRRADASSYAHLHAAFADADGAFFGGHIYAASVFATAEFTLIASDGAGWRVDTLSQPECEPGSDLTILRPHGVGAAGHTPVPRANERST